MAAHRFEPKRSDQENTAWPASVLHPMKEIRIIIQGKQVKFVADLLDSIKATGYTIFHNISGKGHHGFHTAHPMFQ